MVRLGNEAFLAYPAKYVHGRRIGLVINQTSFTPKMLGLLAACRASRDIQVTAIFGPEHGFSGAAQDMESVEQQTLPDGTPVFSLYGAEEKSLAPDPEAMRLVDALVFDIQDVGARYYTFIWTLSFCMEACARAGVEMIVLDRPNPLGGLVVSGALQEEGYCSFVGRFPMPVRHGMTVGEIALWLKGAIGIDCRLTVVPMEGWERRMWFDQTGLPLIPPSPNMPALSTAVVYPGGCLIEGTTLSEGRGTTTPFESVGAPGLSAEALTRRMNEMNLPGCLFRPIAFAPAANKHAGSVCAGVYIHVVDRDAFDAFTAYGKLLIAIAQMFPETMAWRQDAYEFVSDIPAIDLLIGSDRLRKGIDKEKSYDEIFAGTEQGVDKFREERKDFLLYS